MKQNIQRPSRHNKMHDFSGKTYKPHNKNEKSNNTKSKNVKEENKIHTKQTFTFIFDAAVTGVVVCFTITFIFSIFFFLFLT